MTRPRSAAARLAVVALAAALAGCAHRGALPAARGARLGVVVEGRGRLLLEVPPGWTATPGEPQPPVPATVRLDPPEGHFLLLVTPLPDPEAGPGQPARREAARSFVDLARQKALASAAERELPLRTLEGATGWWFTATDRELADGRRAAGPEEFRCLVQGAAVVGQLLLAFTLLDDGDGPQRAAALEVIRRARHEPARAEAGEPLEPPPSEEEPDLLGRRGEEPESPVTLAWPGKGWAVAVALPGFRMQPPRVQPEAGTVSIVGHDERSGLVASIVLVQVADAAGPAACAARDWARIREAVTGLTAAHPPAGTPPRADYLVRTLDGAVVNQQNASTWRFRDGVCVHVHVSLMGFEPSDQPALDRILASVRFDEPL